MIFSGVDDLGDRLVVDAQIRRDAVQRRSLSVCRQDRRDDRYGDALATHPNPRGSVYRCPQSVRSSLQATRRTPTAPTNWPALFLPSQRGQPQQTPKSTRSHLVGHALWPRSNCWVRHAYSERGGGLGEHSLAGGWEAPTARLARQRLPVRGADFNDAPRIDGTNTESVGAVSVSFDSPLCALASRR
jgi:hypothetical protein